MQHPAEDDLALLALGEQVPGVQEHVQGCPRCTAELSALEATVRTARDAGPTPIPPPPGHVWDRISGELDLAPAAPARPAAGPPVRRRWRSPVLLGAAAAVVATALVAVVVVDRPTRPGPDAAALVALPGVTATGQAVLRTGSSGRVLDVDTAGLGPVDGFYEVWLLGPGGSRTLALGTLDAEGRAALPVPGTVRLADYPLVDVSIEPDDGNPAHSSDSVLRGRLRA